MITPFNPSVIARAIEVVRRSEADTTLLALLSPPGRGRRPTYNTTAFLVGSILAVQWKGSLVIRDIHRVLTERLPVDIQRELAVRRIDEEGDERLITEKDLYALTEALGKYLEYGYKSAPKLDEDPEVDAEKRQQRHDQLLELMHSLLGVTLPESPSTSRAIDGTGIWSWGRAPRSAPKDMLQRDAAGEPVHPEARTEPKHSMAIGDSAANDADTADEEDNTEANNDSRRGPHDPDAAYGVKTRKDGERETYYGYELHALVRAPDHPDQEGFIPLFETFELTPAGQDIVAPSLGLIDRSRAMGHTITDLLADRHYSYKTEDRWYFKLLERGIRQHVDLHPNDQGFRDYNGMKLAAGWMHCPCTPDRLGRIDRPPPTADEAAKDAFSDLIDERQPYAMRRVQRLGLDNGARWECPALDGRIGCPLREGTVEVAQLNGLPVIVEPPDLATAPPCCTQRTVTTGRDAQSKIEQEHYWGSRKWTQRYKARTYVEGAFGNMKNPTTENVERGFFRLTGLAKANFMIGIALIAHNLRMLRGNTPLFEAGEGDVLLQQDAECHGFMFVTPEEEAMILEIRASAAPAA